MVPFETLSNKLDSRFQRRVLWLLALSAFFVFAGRAYQHLVWDAPFRTLMWDQSLMEGFINVVVGVDWKTWATQYDWAVVRTQHVFGWFYVALALVSVAVVYWRPSLFKVLLIIGGVALFFLALLYFKGKYFRWGQLFEYSAQFMSPILLFLVVFSRQKASQWMLLAKVALALTFICHGLYAYGYYPRPGYFVDMMIKGFGVSEPTAHNLLWWAGILDFAAAVLIFLPRVSRVALAYMVVWGSATAIARTYTGVYMDFFWSSFSQSFPGTVYRVPHGLLPFIVLMIELKAYGWFGGKVRQAKGQLAAA